MTLKESFKELIMRVEPKDIALYTLVVMNFSLASYNIASGEYALAAMWVGLGLLWLSIT